jgi:hypothetical protein
VTSLEEKERAYFTMVTTMRNDFRFNRVKNNLLLVDLTANNQGVLLIKATRFFVSTTCASIFV